MIDRNKSHTLTQPTSRKATRAHRATLSDMLLGLQEGPKGVQWSQGPWVCRSLPSGLWPPLVSGPQNLDANQISSSLLPKELRKACLLLFRPEAHILGLFSSHTAHSACPVRPCLREHFPTPPYPLLLLPRSPRHCPSPDGPPCPPGCHCVLFTCTPDAVSLVFI